MHETILAPRQGGADELRPAAVLCVGIAVYDEIFALPEQPARPTKVYARNFANAVGGPAANAAVTVARQGGRATLWSRVGADLQGDRILQDLARNGVEVAHVRRCRGARSGVSAVGVSPDGERTIFVFTDARLDPDPSWLPLSSLADYDAVLTDVRWPEAAEVALRSARRLGTPGVLDADVSGDGVALRRLTPLASHAVFSEPGLVQFAGSGDPAAQLAAIRRDQGQTLVGVTLGERGVLWDDAEGLQHEPALSVTAVDTLAAGDVFHGAFALSLAQGHTARKAMRYASQVAGVKCTRWGGGASIPTAEEVEGFQVCIR